MALKLRQGTDAERQTITPKSGELLYVTDTGLVYVGDGTTQGGSLIGGGAGGNLQSDPNPTLSANLNLNGNAIIGSGDIDIEGSISATGSIAFDTVSSSLIPTTDSAFDLGSTAFRWQNGHFTGLFVDGEISANTISLNNIIGPDSSIIYDSLTQSFEGNFRGSLIAVDSTTIIDSDTGNATLNEVIAENIIAENIISNSFEGNFKGSLIAVNSTTIIDGDTGFANFDTIALSSLSPNFNRIEMSSELNETSLEFAIRSNDARSVLKLSKQSESDLSTSSEAYGSIFFERVDINGPLTTGIMAGTGESIVLAVDPTGQFSSNSNFVVFRNDNLGIGTQDPQNTLDVKGEIVSSSFIQFGSFTTLERNSVSAQNGIVIYNITDNRFQGYQNGSWINLDDGSTA